MDDIATNSGVQAPAAGGQGTQQGNEGGQPSGNQGNQQGTQSQGQQGGQPQDQQGTQAPPDQNAGQAGQGGEDQGVTVPLTVVKALQKELSDSKTTVGELKNQLQQVQALQQMGGGAQVFQQPTTQQPGDGNGQPNDAGQQSADPLKALDGLEDGDLVRTEDLKAVIQAVRGMMTTPDMTKALDPINSTLARLQVQIQDPNFENTIRTYLPEMITAQPYLREMIQRAPNPILAALGVARMSPKYLETQKVSQGNGQQGGEQVQDDPLTALQKIIENATKPGAPGAMGGAGTGAMSGLDRFSNMDPMSPEFAAEVSKVVPNLR